MIKNGALRLGRIAGIEVSIHWTWLIIFYIYFQDFSKTFSSPYWIFAEIAIFIAMVAAHETMEIVFGKLAGGTVTELCISFLGRRSNLVPPQRPGPIMLTYFGGILGYCLTLVPVILFYHYVYSHRFTPDWKYLAIMSLVINIVLLAWTAAPVYPLNGGRILRALLWLAIGRRRSLLVACVLGLLSTIAIVAAAFYLESFWWGLGAAMIGFQCIAGFREAKLLNVIQHLPRRTDVACPHCHENPLAVTTIKCVCAQPLDPFATRGQCTRCGSVTSFIACPLCFQRSPIASWFGPVGLFEVQPTAPAPQPPNPVSAPD